MEVKIKKLQGVLNKKLEDIRTKMKNTVTEVKNTLEGNKSRKTEAEEDRVEETTAMEKNKEKRMKRNEDNQRDFWDNIKCTFVCITGSLKKRERD